MNLPKYEKIRQYVIDMAYRHLDAEEPIMSEREICKVFGVTRTTVRKAIKVLIQENVLIPKRGSGLFVNIAPYKNTFSRFSGMHKILFLTSRGHASFYDSWYTSMISKICGEISHTESLLHLCFLTGEPGSEFEEIMMYHPDAVLWLRPDENKMTVLEEIRKHIPVCTLLNAPSGDPFAVTVDYVKAGEMAAEWFIKKGMKKIVYFGRCSENYHSEVLKSFQRGWIGGWLRATGTFDEKLILSHNDDFKAFLNSKAAESSEGFFCHSNVFVGLSQDLAGTRFEEKPVMVDSDYYKISRNCKITPAAEIVIYPDSIFKTVVKNMIMSLEDKNYRQKEIIIEPELKILTKKKGGK